MTTSEILGQQVTYQRPKRDAETGIATKVSKTGRITVAFPADADHPNGSYDVIKPEWITKVGA